MHDGVNHANFLIAGVEVVLNMNGIQHLGHRAKYDVDDCIDDGETEYAFLKVSKDTFPELLQSDKQDRYANDIDFN